MSVYIGSLRKTNDRLNDQLGIALNNVRAYSEIANNERNSNRVLQLNISDLRQSNDKMIQSIDSLRKSLKIKENALKQAVRVETAVQDTLRGKIPVVSPLTPPEQTCDFNVHLISELSPLTKVNVIRAGEDIQAITDISNAQDLLITEDKAYRNKKNFFQRVFTWDWKKDKYSSYIILNSNLSIRITSTRVINITE